VINLMYNRCFGLGGGTRHLHQIYGDDIASTIIIKILVLLG
jgi:hypothetical protein